MAKKAMLRHPAKTSNWAPTKADIKRCEKCGYWEKSTGCCIYILREKKKRPCLPGLACTVRTTKKFGKLKEDTEEL